MAKVDTNKFKAKNLQTDKNDTTHATLQQKKKSGRPVGSKTKKEQSNVSLSVAFTATQKQELIDYAQEDDRTAGYVIKKLLIKEGIISDNK